MRNAFIRFARSMLCAILTYALRLVHCKNFMLLFHKKESSTQLLLFLRQ